MTSSVTKAAGVIHRFAIDESGVTSIEYAIMAFSAAVTIPAVASVGNKLASTFGAVAAALGDGGSPPPAPLAPAS